MSLPEFIEANNIPTGNGVPSGIITALKSQVSNVLSYVVPTSNTATASGAVTNIVTWSGEFVTKHNTEAYVQIEFKERYVFATHYSIRGILGENYNYAMSWYLYGLNSEGETPTLITTNTSAGTTFCGRTSGNCNGVDWVTFAIPNPNISYRFLRFKIKESSSGTWRIVLGGFEVFGVYSNDIRYTADPTKTKMIFLRSCPIGQNYQIHIIFKTILLCS
jgi:hypothetical protein